MTLRRAAVSLSAVVLLALAGCGGGGDDDSADGASESTSASESADATESDSTDTTESSSESESSDGGGGGGGAAEEFCSVYEGFQANASDFQGIPTAEKIEEFRQFADDLEDAAPDEIAGDVATVAKYLRLLAAAASGDLSNGDDLTEVTTEFPSAVAKTAVWASTNCV